MLAARQHANGYLDRLALIGAEQDTWQAELALTQASQPADTAALFQALGGGWWHREETASTAIAGQPRR